MRWTLLTLLVLGCEGPAGPPGGPGSDGSAPTGDAALAPWLTAPAIDISVTDLSFDADHATVSFTLTDGAGTAVDPAGVLTVGPVELGFVVAQLAENPDGSAGQYTAYTTLVQTSPITQRSAVQATTESTGVLHAVDPLRGTYRYEVAAALTGLDPTSTQTVGALAVRTIGTTEALSSMTFSARPDHGAVSTRELVTSATCDGCHRTLDAHGGRWTKPEQCVLCHQPQSTDPDTGNTVDFKVLIHKIHRGAELPSVVAGTPFQIVGFGQSTHDFSTVEFPQNIARCTACHAGSEGDRWKTAPAKAACTSCHDLTSFELPVPAGMTPHGGGSQPDDAVCAVCHPATGSLAGIADKHLVGLLAADAPVVELRINSITNTGPGQSPVMVFGATVDGVARDLIAQPMTSLVATIAGPTTDFSTEWQARIQGTGAVGLLAVADATAETYSYTFPSTAAIPAIATGSYQVALEGYVQPTPTSPRYAAVNPVLAFRVSGMDVVPRRTVVDRALCNSCHFDLAAHGGARKNPQYCAMCHNPAAIDSAGAPRFEATQDVVADSIDFRRFIHKIHMGTLLSGPYVLGGFPLPSIANPAGTQNDFGATRYPRSPKECEACHASRNWVLPMVASTAYAPTTFGVMGCAPAAGNDSTQFCAAPFWTITSTTTRGPEASVCTSCHDSRDVAAHAELNTTGTGGEACSTCHGPGAAFDVGILHGLP